MLENGVACTHLYMRLSSNGQLVAWLLQLSSAAECQGLHDSAWRRHVGIFPALQVPTHGGLCSQEACEIDASGNSSQRKHLCWLEVVSRTCEASALWAQVGAGCRIRGMNGRDMPRRVALYYSRE